MAEETNGFNLAPLNFMGNEHQAFKSKLLALSFSKPSAYFELQDAVRASIKDDFVQRIYDTVYNMLKEGTSADGTIPLRFQEILNGTNMAYGQRIAGPYKGGFFPKVPNQICSKVAIQLAEAMNEEIDKLVETYLIPVDNLKLASKQLRREEVGGRIAENSPAP